ncbi:MAG: hypothetical protein HC923_04770 [Myxococcales bacterium]|nr:hypothetical protein [Myxococcales bacterium]
MEAHQLTGLVLIGIGLADPFIGFYVSKQVPDPKMAIVVKAATAASGLFLVLLGVAFYFGTAGPLG